jgi:hypothetical protein
MSWAFSFDGHCVHGFMQSLLSLLPLLATRFFRSRRDLLLENLALRQQLTVLKIRHPQPRFAASDKLFWVMLPRLWPGWKQVLILVQPETVVGWHHAGFKLYWKWLSRHRTRLGRKCVSKEVRELIFRMIAENATWGAPRIHGKLRMPASTYRSERCRAAPFGFLHLSLPILDTDQATAPLTAN